MKLYMGTAVTISLASLVNYWTYGKTLSCIGTVIQNYFKISSASYTPSVIQYEFVYNLRIVASETRYVLLQNELGKSYQGPLETSYIVEARAIASWLRQPIDFYPVKRG